MKRPSISTLTVILLTFMSRTALGEAQTLSLEHALGAAHLARAELALVNGQLNRGKVHLAAAHEADPSISLFRLKALDMMYRDFPFLHSAVSGYRGGPVAFSMDGRFVAYSTRDSILKLDLETGELKSVGRPRLFVLRIEVSPKGRFVAICDNLGNLALWDMKREAKVGQFTFRKEKPLGLTDIEMSFSLDESSIVAYYRYSDEKAIYFFSTTDLSVMRTVAGVSMGIGPIRFLADGSLLACPGARTALVDPSTMRITKALAPRTGWDVDYLPSKDLLAVGLGGRIEVFNSETQEKIAEYQAASHNIVLVRFLGDGRYIAYASPKGESGIIDCASGKPIQVFNVGHDAAYCPSRYLLFADGKAIDLSACRPPETNLNAETPHATCPDDSAIPEAIRTAMSETTERALLRSSGRIVLALKSVSGDLEAYGAYDGRTFVYDRNKRQVNLLVTDRYRSPIDFAFLPGDAHFVRLCKTGNGMAGAVEVYQLPDGTRTTLRLKDPPGSISIVPDLGVAAMLDAKNRVLLVVLPSLDAIVELLPPTLTKRQIFVDQETKTLMVKTDSEVASYDLNKMSEDRALPSYSEATRLYGISADLFEPSFGQLATPARVELPKQKPVKSGISTIDTAKAMVSRSTMKLNAGQSTDTGPGQGDALPGDGNDSHSCHLTPVHDIMKTMVNYYRHIRITLSDQPSEELHKEPKYGAEKPLYGTMQLGDGEDRFVTIVVDEPEGDPERIYIDRNNDEDLTNDGEGAWSASTSSSLRLSNVKIDVDYTTGQMPYTFTFYRFKTRLRDVVLYYRDSAQQGEIVSGGKTYKIAVVDENADGRFDDLDNGTLLIDLNQDGKLVGRSDSAERYELNQPFNIHGKIWSVDTMSADGSTMVLKSSMAEVEILTYLEPGHPAPAFSGKDLEGNSIELSKEAGSAKYVLLDFWASWCGPCWREFPYLRRLHAEYKDRGLRILGVSLDSRRDTAQQVVQENGLDYPHVFDGLGWKNAVAVQYRVHTIPRTYLLDSNLNIVAKNLRGAGLEQKIATLLGPANNEAIRAAEARRSESLSSRAEVASAHPYVNLNFDNDMLEQSPASPFPGPGTCEYIGTGQCRVKPSLGNYSNRLLVLEDVEIGKEKNSKFTVLPDNELTGIISIEFDIVISGEVFKADPKGYVMMIFSCGSSDGAGRPAIFDICLTKDGYIDPSFRARKPCLFNEKQHFQIIIDTERQVYRTSVDGETLSSNRRFNNLNARSFSCLNFSSFWESTTKFGVDNIVVSNYRGTADTNPESSDSNVASTIAIPPEKLVIPADMQACAENLKKIYAAIKQYEKDKGKLPDWLSDLVPNYLSSETLFCPEDAGHKSPYSPDPKLPCSYGWQFSAKPIPPGWDPTGRTLYRDWKVEQIKLFGDVVPMVRCYHHGSGRVLNLSAGGEIWWGPLDWEYMFLPDYASIHEQTISKAIASRSTDAAPPQAVPGQSTSLVRTLAGKDHLPVRVSLEHSSDMSKWGVGYYPPKSIPLSAEEPPQDWLLPQIDSATQRRFWAQKKFGSHTVMNIVVHAPDDPKTGAWDILTTFDDDVDFRSVMPISIGVNSRTEMEFNVTYGNEAKQPYVIRIGPNALNSGRYFLSYWRWCLRTGTADVLGKEYRITLIDDDSDGLYSVRAGTTVLVSHDVDGHLIYRDRVRADCPIEIGQSQYFTIEISDEGSSALLRPAEYGILEGFVTQESSNTPVPNAHVTTTPYGFEATTGADGRYEMSLPAGRYNEVQIMAHGYIPAHVRRVPWVLHTGSANLSVFLHPATLPDSGEVTLRHGDSFHFLSSRRYKYQGGDFYLGGHEGNPMFWANNEYQGGLVDLGPIQAPLYAVTPPTQGYTRFGVSAEVGHVYVSHAKQGEEGCYIVFTVTKIEQDGSCKLRYYYRQAEVK
jgi:peroxiredoxin